MIFVICNRNFEIKSNFDLQELIWLVKYIIYYEQKSFCFLFWQKKMKKDEDEDENDDNDDDDDDDDDKGQKLL